MSSDKLASHGQQSQGKARNIGDRSERLAKELRANLMKRKAQARARASVKRDSSASGDEPSV